MRPIEQKISLRNFQQAKYAETAKRTLCLHFPFLRYPLTRMMLVFICSNPMQLLITVSRQSLYIINELNRLHLVSNEQLRGKTVTEQAQVLQWIEYGEREINPTSATLVYPCMGIMQFNKQNHERAKDELKRNRPF